MLSFFKSVLSLPKLQAHYIIHQDEANQNLCIEAVSFQSKAYY